MKEQTFTCDVLIAHESGETTRCGQIANMTPSHFPIGIVIGDSRYDICCECAGRFSMAKIIGMLKYPNVP